MKDKIQFGNAIIEYDIVKSKRRKTSQIIIDENGVQVRTPVIKNDFQIKKMVDDKKEWIFRKQLEFADRKKQRDKNLYQTFVPYFGMNSPLEIHTKKNSDNITYSKVSFIVNLKSDYSKTKVVALYDVWLLKKATKYLEARTKKLASKTGLKPSKIIVKSLKSRWGSATKEGIINLNSNLLKTPKDVIDYVIIHELCHLLIRNHSHRFWDLLRKYFPKYLENKIWLERNSMIIVD